MYVFQDFDFKNDIGLFQKKSKLGGGGGRGGGWGYEISRGIKEITCGISQGLIKNEVELPRLTKET